MPTGRSFSVECSVRLPKSSVAHTVTKQCEAGDERRARHVARNLVAADYQVGKDKVHVVRVIPTPKEATPGPDPGAQGFVRRTPPPRHQTQSMRT